MQTNISVSDFLPPAQFYILPAIIATLLAISCNLKEERIKQVGENQDFLIPFFTFLFGAAWFQLVISSIFLIPSDSTEAGKELIIPFSILVMFVVHVALTTLVLIPFMRVIIKLLLRSKTKPD